MKEKSSVLLILLSYVQLKDLQPLYTDVPTHRCLPRNKQLNSITTEQIYKETIMIFIKSTTPRLKEQSTDKKYIPLFPGLATAARAIKVTTEDAPLDETPSGRKHWPSFNLPDKKNDFFRIQLFQVIRPLFFNNLYSLSLFHIKSSSPTELLF